MTTATASAGAPPLRLLGLEPWRAACEYAGMRLMPQAGLPRGDGHPVVVFPGLAADGQLTAPLRSFCERLGYAAYDWERGINRGPGEDVDAWLRELADETAAQVAEHDLPVSLIGWSLGGIYAREVAKLMPRRVRQVITIGTPFAGQPSQTNASAIYRLLNGREAEIDPVLRARLRQAPPVPTTSIYSRSDGVVAWQACVQEGSAPDIENLEVQSSHCGMVWNPEVLQAVAYRLAAHERPTRRA